MLSTDEDSRDFKILIHNPQEKNDDSSSSKFDNHNPPHHGKEISELIISPDLSYVVTFSRDDSSIVGWPVYENYFEELTYDTERKSENITEILQLSDDGHVLVQVFDSIYQKSFYKIIELNPNGNNIYLVKGNPDVDKGTFVAGTNDLFMIFGNEATAHLYSNSTGEWKIKRIFRFDSISRYKILKLRYFITPEKLFITYEGCNILSQWDIATMTFEKQYFLDVKFDNLHPSTSCLKNDTIEQQILFNHSKTLMAIYGFSTYNIEHQVVIYSTRSCIRIASFIMDYGTNSVLRLNFFGTSDHDEGLLVRERGSLLIEPSYYFNDYNCESAQINIEQLFIHPPDNSDVEIILNKNYNSRVVGCSHGKIIHYDINKYQLEKFQEKLKMLYYSRPSRAYLLKNIKELFKTMKERNYSFTQKTYELHKINVRWKVFHYSGTGRTHIVACERNKKVDEYTFFESRIGYVYACKPIYNGDLIMVTKQGIMIFTFHTKNKKIQMCYFWDNDDWYNLWKEQKQLTNDLNENEGETFFGETAEKELSKMELLPPMNIERIFDEYETSYISGRSDHERRFVFKELLANYLEDVATLAELGEGIFKMAIEKNKRNIVDLVYGLVMDNIRKDSDAYMGLLSIITTSLSRLQECYPEVVKSYTLHTSLMLDHHCVEIIISETRPFYGFTRDQQIFENDVFYNIYSKIFTFYCNVHNMISPLFDKRKIQHYGRPAVTLVVPLPKFASYSTNYNFLKDFIRPEANGFVEQEYHDLYKCWNGEALLHFKWNTFGKYYYYANWALFFVFLLIFIFASNLSSHILPDSSRKVLLIVVILFGMLYLSNEIRQFIWRPRYYFHDLWNIFDLSACCFPIATSIYWIKFGHPPPGWVLASSNLLLEIKFLLYLRIFESYGRYFTIILGVAYRVFSFLIILLMIIISFSHAFYIILGQQKDLLRLTDKYYATNSDSTLNPKEPDTNTNMFAWPGTALLAMYMFLLGDNSFLQSWTYLDHYFIIFLAISFSFITVIYLANLFIGLLCNEINDYNDRVSYLVQKAKFIAEIELFCLLPPQRRWRTWFPDWIYYEVPVDYVRKKIRNIDADEENSEFLPIISSRLRNLVNVQKGNDLSDQIGIMQNFLEQQFHQLHHKR